MGFAYLSSLPFYPPVERKDMGTDEFLLGGGGVSKQTRVEDHHIANHYPIIVEDESGELWKYVSFAILRHNVFLEHDNHLSFRPNGYIHKVELMHDRTCLDPPDFGGALPQRDTLQFHPFRGGWNDFAIDLWSPNLRQLRKDRLNLLRRD